MFWERFYNLCEWKKIKPLQVVKELNIAAGSITKWKNGAIPGGANLCLIADYFEVSIDYLLGRTDHPFETELLSNVVTLLNQEQGELKLKIFYMTLGMSEEDADINVALAKNDFEYDQAIASGVSKEEAQKILFPMEEHILSKEDWREFTEKEKTDQDHAEIRLKRIEELKRLLKGG